MTSTNVQNVIDLENEATALKNSLRAVLNEYDRNTCQHGETHRGGAIWTICSGCGRKWADDEGGFKPYCDPTPIAEARALLTKVTS